MFKLEPCFNDIKTCNPCMLVISIIYSGKDEKIKTLRKELEGSNIKISKLESESIDLEARYQQEVEQVKQATTELVRFKQSHQMVVKENQDLGRTVSSIKSHVKSLEKVSFPSSNCCIS